MNLFVLGINHKTAPIDIREKFYLTSTEQDLFLAGLRLEPIFVEALILSTCNRTEVYLTTLDDFDPFDCVLKILADIKKIPDTSIFKNSFYIHKNDHAVEHFLRVSTGLDSLVIGERQILGQVKGAVERARAKGMLQKNLNILSNFAIEAGKKVQTETQISFGGSSISWAAIAKAEEILGSLKDRSILLIGAGKMSELTVGQIQNKNFKKLYLMNRTESNAQELAQKHGGEAVGFWDMKEVLREVDICICSASAPHYILEKATLEKVMGLRQNPRLILIDISMPRNIDPAVKTIPNVYLYEIDDLNQVVEGNMKIRQNAIAQVETIIRQKLTEYHERLKKDESFDPHHAARKN